ncbi:MFS transporter, AAHS family, benzoate transport protein [Lentibacillus persicus]|uniref:MFS transporter, AAHS family, benzoate transport protein n=1 Tax=Lentibacillus persicus TaxID=640948 RepID=A0A1I1SEU9_9BACI|nr:MFS transporter [Lentibacillus persicus]SFD43148.1 MFS transporter, AAHS family, benzoate transport protein [Lentibacillus persicus]
MSKINVNNTVDNSKFNSFHLLLVFFGFLILLADGYDLMVYGAVLPSLIDEWSITASTAGFIGSLTLVGGLLGNLIFGILGDKVGRKKTIISCVFSFSFFTVLCGFALGPVDFAVYRFIAGLALGGVMPIIVSLTSEYAPKSIRSMLVGVASTGFAVGGILVALIGSNIITNIGWQWMFYTGGFPLLIIPFLIKYLPDSLAFHIKNKENKKVRSILKKLDPSLQLTDEDVFEVDLPKKGVPLSELFKEKRTVSTLGFWVSTFMLLLMVYGLGTWLPQLMVEAGYALNSSLTFLLALNFGAMFGQVGGGLLADCNGSKKVLIGMFILGAISLTLFGLQFEAIMLYLLAGIAGSCTTGGQAVNNAYASRFYPVHAKSTGVGWALGIGRFGAIVGPSMGGLLLASNIPIYMNFIMFAIPGLLGAVAISFVQDKYSELALNKKIRTVS